MPQSKTDVGDEFVILGKKTVSRKSSILAVSVKGLN